MISYLFNLSNVCMIHVYICMHVCSYMWKSYDNLWCQSVTSTFFVPSYARLVGPCASQKFLTSTSSIMIGALRLQTTAPACGFMWVLGIKLSGPHTCLPSTHHWIIFLDWLFCCSSFVFFFKETWNGIINNMLDIWPQSAV